MSYYDSDTASTLGVLDQLAASDERAFGAGLLRRMAQQANLLRDYPTVLAALAWPLDQAGGDALARFDLLIASQAWVPLVPLSSPWWPAHAGYEARARVRLPSSEDVQIRLRPGDEVTVTGTGSWQTVSLSGGLETAARAVDWLFELRADQTTSTAASAGTIMTSGTNPHTLTSDDYLTRFGIFFAGSTPRFDVSAMNATTYQAVFQRGGVELFRRTITRAQVDGLEWSEPVPQAAGYDARTGDTITIVGAPQIELAGLTIIGGTT